MSLSSRLDAVKAVFVCAVMAWPCVVLDGNAFASVNLNAKFSSMASSIGENIVVLNESEEGNPNPVHGVHLFYDGMGDIARGLVCTNSSPAGRRVLGNYEIKVVGHGSYPMIYCPNKFLGGALACVLPNHLSADYGAVALSAKSGIDVFELNVGTNLSNVGVYGFSRPFDGDDTEGRRRASKYDHKPLRVGVTDSKFWPPMTFLWPASWLGAFCAVYVYIGVNFLEWLTNPSNENNRRKRRDRN